MAVLGTSSGWGVRRESVGPPGAARSPRRFPERRGALGLAAPVVPDGKHYGGTPPVDRYPVIAEPDHPFWRGSAA